MTTFGAAGALAIVAVIGVALAFLPAIIAVRHEHHHTMPILTLCAALLLLSLPEIDPLAGVGWIVALGWSVTPGQTPT